MVQTAHAGSEEVSAIQAGKSGDEAGFASLAEHHRRELQVHCYRMVASYEDAEDLVQETFLRAWKNLASFEGRSSFKTWLYRIATNACLDFLERSRRRVTANVVHADTDDEVQPPPHIPWLQPYPDRVLDPPAPRDAEPDAALVAKETIELAFLVAVQLLPPKQRAVLILRDVLGWSAQETAELLGGTSAAVHAALQRARATVREYRRTRGPEAVPRDTDDRERELVQRYADAAERGDAAGVAALLEEDVRFAMPPETGTYVGRDLVVASWVEGGFGSPTFGEFKCVITRANRMPAVACYVRKPGDTLYRAFAVDVLDMGPDGIAEVTGFALGPSLLDAFGLPPTLEGRLDRLGEFLERA